MKLKVVNDFLVGCDPELALMNGSSLYQFSDYFSSVEGIGHDHGGRVGELHPEPSKSCWTLVRRIKALIGKMGHLSGTLRAGAMAGRQPLGGHVHLDVNPHWDEKEQEFKLGTYVKSHFERITALDCLTQLLEHLDILPTRECLIRRSETEYGHFGALRIPVKRGVHVISYQPKEYYKKPEFKDSHRTEYRAMASWLTSPKIAHLCLTGAKLATFAPAYTISSLKGETSYTALHNWLESFKTKDRDVERVLLSPPTPKMVVDPTSDIRPRWAKPLE